MKTVLIACALLAAQDFSLDSPAEKKHQFVSFAAENLTVPAGKRAVLELRFAVEKGYHVNSHKPKSELQIPTVIDLRPANGVVVAAAEYPAGRLFTLAADPVEKLDVYQDQFVVKLPVTATAGAHELKGELRYQACDHAACYPPKSLPLDVLFTAK